jgi:peptidoglycan/LPS O-acetylase OafA/YrhL
MGTHFSFPSAFGSNGPLWSLCNEFWYYMAFPVLVLALSKPIRWPVRLLCLFLLAIWVPLVGKSVVLLGIPWLAGAALHFVVRPKAPRWWPRGRGAMLWLVCALAVLCAPIYRGLPEAAVPQIVGLSTVFVMLAILQPGEMRLPGWFQGLAHKAASSSYTLYLVHMPVLIFLKASLHLPQQKPGGLSFLEALGLLIAVLVYARIVYFLFERRTESIRQWLRPCVTGASDLTGHWLK